MCVCVCNVAVVDRAHREYVVNRREGKTDMNAAYKIVVFGGKTASMTTTATALPIRDIFIGHTKQRTLQVIDKTPFASKIIGSQLTPNNIRFTGSTEYE